MENILIKYMVLSISEKADVSQHMLLSTIPELPDFKFKQRTESAR